MGMIQGLTICWVEILRREEVVSTSVSSFFSFLLSILRVSPLSFTPTNVSPFPRSRVYQKRDRNILSRKSVQVESVFLIDLSISLLIRNQEESHLRRLIGKNWVSLQYWLHSSQVKLCCLELPAGVVFKNSARYIIYDMCFEVFCRKANLRLKATLNWQGLRNPRLRKSLSTLLLLLIG